MNDKTKKINNFYRAKILNKDLIQFIEENLEFKLFFWYNASYKSEMDHYGTYYSHVYKLKDLKNKKRVLNLYLLQLIELYKERGTIDSALDSINRIYNCDMNQLGKAILYQIDWKSELPKIIETLKNDFKKSRAEPDKIESKEETEWKLSLINKRHLLFYSEIGINLYLFEFQKYWLWYEENSSNLSDSEAETAIARFLMDFGIKTPIYIFEEHKEAEQAEEDEEEQYLDENLEESNHEWKITKIIRGAVKAYRVFKHTIR